MITNVDRPILTRTWTTRARTAALVFAAVLIAAPLLAQRHAQPRSGGGGGGGGYSGGGHRSAGPSASAPSSRGGGGGGGSWDGGGHRPPGSGGGAPHRPPGYDRGHGHGGHHGGYGYYYGYPYYYPYYGFSFGFGYGYPYYYGYSPYYYGGYYPYYYGYRPYYYGYGYRPYYYPPAYSYGYEGAVYGPAGEGTAYDRASLGAVAVKVKPKSAEVYVDGNYVGAAGSFDGFPGYLWIPPGDHRIEVVQVGYANLVAEIEVGSGQVVELGQNLQRGESVRPAPPANRYAPRDGERAPYRDGERAPYPENDYRAAPPLERRDPAEDGRERRFESADMGGLFLDVRPDDASVYLDGRFVGTGREVSTATEPLRLMPGEHRLQVIHPDYPNQEESVEIGAGEEKRVEVTLRRGAGI